MKKTINEMGKQKIGKMIDDLLNNEKTRSDILCIVESKEWKALYKDIIYKHFDYTCCCAGSRCVAEMIVERVEKILNKIDEEIKNEEEYEISYEISEAEQSANSIKLYEEIMRFTYGKLSFDDWETLGKIIMRASE